MRREVVGLALAGFVVFGFVSWIAGMPKPSDAPLQAAPVVVATASAAAPSAPAAAGASAVGGSAAPEAASTDAAAAGESPAPAPANDPVAAPVSTQDIWAEDTSAATGIPSTSLGIYAAIADAQQQQTPGCRLGWNMLAALADPVDVTPEAIEASSRAVAAQLCEGGADLAAPGGLEAALTAHGRSPASAHLAAVLAAAHATASTT